MSAKNLVKAARPLGRWGSSAGSRRSFFTSSSLRQEAGHQAGEPGPKQSPVWTGTTVFAVAAGAGLVGWGLATVMSNNAPSKNKRLLDSKSPMPQYANKKDMELVRSDP